MARRGKSGAVPSPPVRVCFGRSYAFPAGRTATLASIRLVSVQTGSGATRNWSAVARLPSVSRRELVEDGDPTSRAKRAVGEVDADKAGPAGDQDGLPRRHIPVSPSRFTTRYLSNNPTAIGSDDSTCTFTRLFLT